MNLKTLPFFACVTGLALVTSRCTAPEFPPNVKLERTRQGLEISFTINQPNVTQPVTDYPQYTFQPGDVVYVTAGGCVQTTGALTARKARLYVNPSSPTDYPLELKFLGRIWIPGATMGLETIDSVINRSPVVVATPPPGAEASFLRLGYDSTSDYNNSYTIADTGVNNQCLNVGPAWVSLRIVRNGGSGASRSCPAAPVPANMTMDPFWNAIDPNYLPINPQWGAGCYQTADNVDPAPLCNNTFINSVGQTNMSCTTFLPGLDTLTFPFNEAPGTYGVNGHLNWGFATFVGTIYYDQYSRSLFLGPQSCMPWSGTGDDDLNLMVVTPNQAGVVKQGSIVPDHGILLPDGSKNPDIGKLALKGEFAWRDAIGSNNPAASTPLWVAANPKGSRWIFCGDDPYIRLWDGRPAIVIGLLGLDMVHGQVSEIHPVLGLAVQVRSPARGDTEEVWMIMTRRQGDEGFRSYGGNYAFLHQLAGSSMRFALPTSYSTWAVNSGAEATAFFNGFGSNSYSVTPWVNSPQGNSVILSIPYPPPSPSFNETVLGELHLYNSSAPSGCVPKTCAQLNAACGTISDGCGTLLNCGTCTVAGQTCGGAGVPYQCGCELMNYPCSDRGANCGSPSNGCGGTIGPCGTCVSPNTCGGGGTPNVCGGPLLWFTFDEPSGTGTVSNSGTLGNVNQTVTFAQQGVPGKVNLAIQFNGSTNGVSLADQAALNGFTNLTLEAWVYYNSFNSSTYSTIAKKDSAYILRTYTNPSTAQNILEWYLWNGGGFKSLGNPSIPTPSLNTWYHVAATYDGNTGQMVGYWNGDQIGSASVGGGAISISTIPLWLGNGQYGGENLIGNLDEFKLFSTTRTPTEICADALRTWNGSSCN